MGGGVYMITLMEASSLLCLPASHIESVLSEDRESMMWCDDENNMFDEGEECEQQ